MWPRCWRSWQVCARILGGRSIFHHPVDSKVVLVETLGSWPASEPAKMCDRLTETSLPGWLLVPGHSVIRLAGWACGFLVSRFNHWSMSCSIQVHYKYIYIYNVLLCIEILLSLSNTLFLCIPTHFHCQFISQYHRPCSCALNSSRYLIVLSSSLEHFTALLLFAFFSKTLSVL